MAFDFPAGDQLVDIIPAGVRFSKLTELLDETKPSRAPEMEWRWAILDIAHNAMVSPQRYHSNLAKGLFQNEARWRASAFLQLALLDSQALASSVHRPAGFKWQSAIPRHLLRIYRNLWTAQDNYATDGAQQFDTVITGLISTYAPAVDVADIKVELRNIPLTLLRSNALILSAGLLVQGFLQRACVSGLAGRLHVNLIHQAGETYRLTIHISEESSAVLSSESLEIALRLLGVCQAEFVCSDTGLGGTTINISINGDPISPC